MFAHMDVNLIVTLISDHPDRFAEDSTSSASCASGAQTRSLQRIRGCSVAPVDVFLCSHCPLACLHLVCNWKDGATFCRRKDW